MKVQDMGPEEMHRRAIAGHAMMMAGIVRAVYERWGDEGIKVMQQGLERTGREVASSLAKHMGVRVGDGDALDCARLEELFHKASLMETKTLELTPRKWLVWGTSCPAADQYRRIFPDFCPWLLVSLDQGMCSVVNPKIKVRMTGTCLSRGDDHCEYLLEVED